MNKKLIIIISTLIIAITAGIVFLRFFKETNLPKEPLTSVQPTPAYQTNYNNNEIMVGTSFIGLRKEKIQELLNISQNSEKIIVPIVPTEQTNILFFEPKAEFGNVNYFYLTNPKNNLIYNPTLKEVVISNAKFTLAFIKNKKIPILFAFKLENTGSFQFPIKIPAGNVGSVLFSSLTSYTPELTPAGNFEGVTNIPNKYVYISAPKFALKNIAEKDKEEFYKNFIFLKYNNRYVFLAE